MEEGKKEGSPPSEVTGEETEAWARQRSSSSEYLLLLAILDLLGPCPGDSIRTDHI